MPSKFDWNARSAQDWAHALGLVNIPLFGAERPNSPEGDYAVLLDGRRSSFGLFSSDDSEELIYGDSPLSWSWSANLRHILIVNSKAKVVVHRRWDAPDKSTKFPIPNTPIEAADIFAQRIEATRSRAGDGVIGRMLGAFRQVRANLAQHTTDAVDAMRVFNAFLVGTELVRRGELAPDDWRNCHSVRDAIECIRNADDLAEVDQIPASVADIEIGGLLGAFLDPDPRTGCELEPDLLIRHASGLLYQDAHFELEREAQGTLPGMAGDPRLRPSLQRDARFTQPALARGMVQQAITAYKGNAVDRPLVILDPACGSGIFLQHALQELSGQPNFKSVRLVGFDTSAVSCVIARFCLRWAARDATAQGLRVEQDISERNALGETWPTSDLILTNPPFAAWKKMHADDRKVVKEVLGSLFKGHADKAMAFIWKAVESILPGGVVASVLPSPLLETDAGERWRAKVLSRAHMAVVGRFRGYSFFQNAMVEPAFIIMRGKAASDEARMPVQALLADEGAEDESLRSLRRNRPGGEEAADKSYSVFAIPAETITSASWLPRSKTATELILRLRDLQTATVGELFSIDQGVLTGRNSAFMLSRDEYFTLPEKERQFFFPAIGSSTIRGGQILEEEYVFYPYSAVANSTPVPRLNSIGEVREAVQHYYKGWLLPHEEALRRREGFGESNWWLLTRVRKWPKVPKLVTGYFGACGSFSFDSGGRFVVVQGYTWRWKGSSLDAGEEQDESLDETEPLDFNSSPLPWAYIATLNSAVFETMLSHECPRVQGGQFNLSDRFVSNAFLPDLSDDGRVVADDVKELARLGQDLFAGRPLDLAKLDLIVAKVYGVLLADVLNAPRE